MPLLSSLVPDDFRQATTAPLRRYFLLTTLECIGGGLTMSLYVVYLHDVRHFSITFATLLLASTAVLGLVTSPLVGTVVDRIGPVPVLCTSMLLESGFLVLWALARQALLVVVAGLVLGIFGGAIWGPGNTLLTRLVAPEHLQRAFGVNFMLVNLGFGLGGLISAAIVDLGHPFTFTVLYLLNSGVSLLIAALFLTLRVYGHADPEHRDNHRTRDEGWREVLADRRLVRYVVCALVLMLGGYASQEAGFSLFVVNDLHLSVHVIGVIFFFNTSTIVVAQLFILNRIAGRSRTRVMAVGGVLWTVFWLVLYLSLHLPPVVAVLALCAAMAVFAVGETMMSPVGSALVNEIAPEHLRGRYNAAAGLVWGVAGTLAPSLTAFFFAEHWDHAWPLVIGGCALGGSLGMLSLRRRLTPREDGLGPTDPGSNG